MTQTLSQKKIAFINTSSGWGGLEMNTLKLAKAFKNMKIDVSLITVDNSTILANHEDTFSQVLSFQRIKKYFAFGKAKQIHSFLKENDINTIFIFDNSNIDVISWVKRLFNPNLNVIYQQHMQMGIDKKDWLHTFRFNAIDSWVSPLLTLKQGVLQRTRIAEERIKVIPLGLAVELFIIKKYDKNEAKEKLKIPQDTIPLVGIIGRVTEKKGQLDVLKAIHDLQLKGVPCRLLVFGSPTVNELESDDYYAIIKDYISTHQLTTVVYLVPYSKDVKLFYDAIDVFIMASESETYGMVTLEVMLCGVQVIGTNSGGTSELLKYGEWGTLVPYKNIAAYSTAINNAIQNPVDSVALQSIAIEVAKKYALANEVDGLIELI